MVESSKAFKKIIGQRSSNIIFKASLDLKGSHCKKSIKVCVSSTKGPKSLKDQNEKAKALQENQLRHLIVYNLPKDIFHPKNKYIQKSQLK